MTDRDALIHRIAGAIARKTAIAAPAEVLAELSTTHVLVERFELEALTDHAVLGGCDPFLVKRMRGMIDLGPIGPDAAK